MEVTSVQGQFAVVHPRKRGLAGLRVKGQKGRRKKKKKRQKRGMGRPKY